MSRKPQPTQHAPSPDMPAAVANFPLEPGETLLWYRESVFGSGYELRIRTAAGFESLHDTYGDEIDAQIAARETETPDHITIALSQADVQHAWDALNLRADALRARASIGDLAVAAKYDATAQLLVDAVKASGGRVEYGQVNLNHEAPVMSVTPALIDGQRYWLGACWGRYNADGDYFVLGNTWVSRQDTLYREAQS